MVEQSKIKVLFHDDNAQTENSEAAAELYNQSRYGDMKKENIVQLSMIETYYLMEKGKIELYDSRNHKIDSDMLLRKAKKKQPQFLIRYAVFKDLRDRGYIVKTALKFGADFRVYDRGVKPGDDHAKWVVFPVHEGNVLTWQEFAAKNRVAHSTKKRLLLGVVDDESDVSYWECRWIRP
jgi:tRNA-intron endonuclease